MTYLYRAIASTLLTVALWAPTAAADNRAPLADSDVRELMNKHAVPSVAVAVVMGADLGWSRTYGVADVEQARKATETTRYQAASISKPVTAVAVVRLAREGRLSLDQDINGLLKSWKAPQPVTFRAIFSHTSGADDGFGFPGYEPDAPLPTVAQILNGEPPSNVGPVLFARPPYQTQKYSGGGITIAQLAMVEHLSKSFEALMDEIVLAPLAMTHSTFRHPQGNSRDYAFAHGKDGKRMGAPWHVYPEMAAAGLWTTPRDLARVIIDVQRALAGDSGKVLTPDAARDLVTAVGVGPYGVGFRIFTPGNNGGWYFGHNGSNWGFRARIMGHMRKEYGWAIMTNSEAGVPLINEIEQRLIAAYGWDQPDERR